MRTELKRLHLENDSTTVYVTHDQVEAMSLADRIAIMNEGVLQQVGTPSEVYLHPANLFVAQFVGSPVMNIAKAKVQQHGAATRVMLGEDAIPFEFPAELTRMLEQKTEADEELALGIRPEGVIVAREAKPGYVPVEAHIIEPLGAYDIVDLKLGQQFLRARTPSGYVGRVGDTVWTKLDEAQTHFFRSRSGESLQIRLG
jgi:multiple sugar transport system ATP-binding protein